MSRKFIVLHFVLLALAGVLVWQLRVRWLDAEAKQREILARKVAAKKPLAPALPSAPAPAAPAEYLDVAQRTLFSKDRNPNVVVEPPKPTPEPPMPALPHYHGQMGFGDPVAFLSVNSGAQKGYHAGENVGDFKLAGFDSDMIAFEWHGKKVEKKLEELVAKDVAPPAAPSSGQPGAQPNAAAAARNGAPEVRSTAPVMTIIAPSSGSSGNVVSASGNMPSAIGPEIGGGLRGCVPTDDSPAGTVLSGFKKNVVKSMFGEICRWEPAK
jgi:hypothetical protein